MEQRTFLFRLSEGERQRLVDLAVETGLPRGEILRQLIRKAVVVTAIGLCDETETATGDKTRWQGVEVLHLHFQLPTELSPPSRLLQKPLPTES